MSPRCVHCPLNLTGPFEIQGSAIPPTYFQLLPKSEMACTDETGYIREQKVGSHTDRNIWTDEFQPEHAETLDTLFSNTNISADKCRIIRKSNV